MHCSTYSTNNYQPRLQPSPLARGSSHMVSRSQSQAHATVPQASTITTPVIPASPRTPQQAPIFTELPTLQNLVSTVNLNTALDLIKIAQLARNAEYNPRRFAAVVMRIRDPRTTALIFGSGKIVVTGAKSVELSRQSARKFARIIQKLGPDVIDRKKNAANGNKSATVKFSDFKVQNMVGSIGLPFRVNLERLDTMGSISTITYEPEQFPGLIFRMASPKIVLLVFYSGKIVLTGGKCKDDIDTAFRKIYPVLYRCKQTVVNGADNSRK